MDAATLKEIQYVSKKAEDLIYFKDKYALHQMAQWCKDGKSVREVKDRFPQYISKPIIKSIIQKLGNGPLLKDHFEQVLPNNYSHFIRSLDKWGPKPQKHRKDGYYQTSRSGYSLVIQLNFGFDHDIEYFRYMIPIEGGNNGFNYSGHPIQKKGLKTMA